MMALAEYFSKKKWPSLGQPPAPADVAARAQRANGSVGCTGCHQASYHGEGTQPRLAGQCQEYLQQSMLDFRTRKRGNNPGMSDLMKATSEDDLRALAEYLAGCRAVRHCFAASCRARLVGGEVEGRFSLLVAQRTVRAAGEQDLDDPGVAELGGGHQRGAAAIVDRVDAAPRSSTSLTTSSASRAPAPSA